MKADSEAISPYLPATTDRVHPRLLQDDDCHNPGRRLAQIYARAIAWSAERKLSINGGNSVWSECHQKDPEVTVAIPVSGPQGGTCDE